MDIFWNCTLQTLNYCSKLFILMFSILYLFTEFSIQADQIERLANWQIPPSKKSGNYKHSTLSKNEFRPFKQGSTTV